jgi:hypothetical protein
VPELSKLDVQVQFFRRELATAKRRLRRWLAVCAVFSIGVFSIAAYTKSAFFVGVAGLGCFFVWNRWKCYRIVQTLCSQPVPSNNEEHVQWVNTIKELVLYPPSWWTSSEAVSAAILLSLFAIVSFFAVSASGWWIRILCAVTWAVVILSLTYHLKIASAHRSQEHSLNNNA